VRLVLHGEVSSNGSRLENLDSIVLEHWNLGEGMMISDIFRILCMCKLLASMLLVL
jgi:hypothetical protein